MTQRTNQQSRALHLFFELLADVLNSAGLDQRVVLKPSVSIPWDKDSVKEQLWRPIQKAALHKESTTELEKIEDINKVHEILMRHLGEKFHVEYIPFPQDEKKIAEYYLKISKLPAWHKERQ